MFIELLCILTEYEVIQLDGLKKTDAMGDYRILQGESQLSLQKYW